MTKTRNSELQISDLQVLRQWNFWISMKRGFGEFRVMHRVDLALTRVFLVILNPGTVGRRKFSPEHYREQL